MIYSLSLIASKIASFASLPSVSASSDEDSDHPIHSSSGIKHPSNRRSLIQAVVLDEQENQRLAQTSEGFMDAGSKIFKTTLDKSTIYRPEVKQKTQQLSYRIDQENMQTG